MADPELVALIADALATTYSIEQKDRVNIAARLVADALDGKVVMRSQVPFGLLERTDLAEKRLVVVEARIAELEAEVVTFRDAYRDSESRYIEAEARIADLENVLRWRLRCVGEECEDAEYEAARLLGEQSGQ